jgi:hypothetical protein
MLADFFLADSSRDRMPNSGGGFIVLDRTMTGGPVGEQCRNALAALPSGGVLAIAIRLGASGRARRLSNLLTLPLQMARAERALKGYGVTGVGRYGVTPNLEAPAVIFPLGTPAARYAATHLVPGSAKRLLSLMRKILTYCMGYDPSLGAILIVGRKP